VARVLGCTGGERMLTDLRHIGQVLHKVSTEERLGPVALTAWLREQIADGLSGRADGSGERTRRLDSDAAAVQLVTIHGSKGLEYPVVYLPTLWDRFPRDPDVALFHGPDGARCRNVGGPGPGWTEDVRRHQEEDSGETLRLLYVAMTRAQSQVVAWYAPASRNAPTSALHRLLLGRRPGTAVVPDTAPVDDSLVAKLDWYAANAGPVWEPAVWAAAPAAPLPVSTEQLGVRSFDRSIDTAWRRTSYSALTAVDPGAPTLALSEPEVVPRDDEADGAPGEDLATSTDDGAAADLRSPMADLPVGATFGSLVHAVLEHADPLAPAHDGDLRAELLHHIDEQLVWWPVTLTGEASGERSDRRLREELADALVAVCDTPLGPLAGEATLRQVTRADRLCELDFELPLAGGDLAEPDATPGVGLVTLGDLVPLLEQHLPEGDPVRGYTSALRDPVLGGQSLKGYLTGSIDVVLRVEVDGAQRFLTVDYKTNWLGEIGADLSALAYRPEALDDAMGHSDYPLQALLYVVVQHRYLRWRLPGYDPAVHLGGVLYLYLRGLAGPDTPRVDGKPCGVFAWQPPVALVEALSDLLDGKSS
jgi:exodeoxyribonuclease V beta subunit